MRFAIIVQMINFFIAMILIENEVPIAWTLVPMGLILVILMAFFLGREYEKTERIKDI
jgi:hypothetical protein